MLKELNNKGMNKGMNKELIEKVLSEKKPLPTNK